MNETQKQFVEEMYKSFGTDIVSRTDINNFTKENGYKDNLRDWFKLIYEVVFGDENGPRIGFFISFFGVKETQNLIKEKIM